MSHAAPVVVRDRAPVLCAAAARWTAGLSGFSAPAGREPGTVPGVDVALPVPNPSAVAPVMISFSDVPIPNWRSNSRAAAMRSAVLSSVRSAVVALPAAASSVASPADTGTAVGLSRTCSVHARPFHQRTCSLTAGSWYQPAGTTRVA